MNGKRHGGKAWTKVLPALAMGFLYLLIAAQVAFPVRKWMEAASESAVQKEAFACALHKCQCQNALQCRTHCCCFPKASAEDSHAHEEGDGLAAHWAKCGGSSHDQGALPLPPHILTESAVPLSGAPAGRMEAARFPKPPSPLLEPPFKIPV